MNWYEIGHVMIAAVAVVGIAGVIAVEVWRVKALASCVEPLVQILGSRKSAPPDPKVVYLDDRREHRVGNVRCHCGAGWVAVAPVACERLQCPKCGQMTPWGDS